MAQKLALKDCMTALHRVWFEATIDDGEVRASVAALYSYAYASGERALAAQDDETCAICKLRRAEFCDLCAWCDAILHGDAKTLPPVRDYIKKHGGPATTLARTKREAQTDSPVAVQPARVFKCASPTCPGLPQPASEFAHQINCGKPAAEGICARCGGCKQIADTPEGEPWSAWESLPEVSKAAVRVGAVKQLPCPACCPRDSHA